MSSLQDEVPMLLCESHSPADIVLVWSCSERRLVCQLCHTDSRHHTLSLEGTRSLLRSKEAKEPETMMKMIQREMERKISVRLDHLLEEFSEKLEVQRRELVEDYNQHLREILSRNKQSNNKLDFNPVIEDFYSLQLTEGRIEAEWPAIVKIPTKSDEEEDVVEVLYVESPRKIHVRNIAFSAAWREFSQEIQEAGVWGDYLETGDLQVNKVLCGLTEGRWERVQMKEVAETGPHTVKLVDQGRMVKISGSNLRALTRELRSAETLREEVSLVGLERAGAGQDQDWWDSVQNALTEIIKPGDRLVMRRNLNCSQNNKVELFLQDTLPTGPTSSLLEVVLDRINDLSVEEVPDVEVLEETAGVDEINNNHNILSSVRASRWRKPSLLPLQPKQELFTARILHIDQTGVVWVIPSDHLQIQWEVSRLLQYQTRRLRKNPQVGLMLICTLDQEPIRVRILNISETEDKIFFINIDTGKEGQCSFMNLHEIRGDLLSLPPLAVPLKLYGVKKISEQEKFARGVETLLPTITKLEVKVSALKCPQDTLPLPVTIRYSAPLPLPGEHQLLGNLALDLLAGGLMELVGQWSGWEREYQDHHLNWLLGPDPIPHPLSFLPHPFPLAAGQWLCVTVEGLLFPLVNGEEADTTTITTPGANMVACHLQPCHPQFRLEKEKSSILASLKISRTPLALLESAFERFKDDLALPVSPAAFLEDRPGEGEEVLTMVEGEWCRVRVEREERIFFTDYGHYGSMENVFRKLSYQQRMKPVEAVNLHFKMPADDETLQSVRDELGRTQRLVRIERIQQSEDETEIIMASFWRIDREDTSECFRISKII